MSTTMSEAHEVDRERVDMVVDADTASGFDDPLAVRVGLYVGADDLPCEGWPADFKPEVVSRLLSYMPADD